MTCATPTAETSGASARGVLAVVDQRAGARRPRARGAISGGARRVLTGTKTAPSCAHAEQRLPGTRGCSRRGRRRGHPCAPPRCQQQRRHPVGAVGELRDSSRRRRRRGSARSCRDDFRRRLRIQVPRPGLCMSCLFVEALRSLESNAALRRRSGRGPARRRRASCRPRSRWSGRRRAGSRPATSATSAMTAVMRTRGADLDRRDEADLVEAVVDLRASRPRRRTARSRTSTASESVRKPWAIGPPNGPSFARSGSTWIHWWSSVASANVFDALLGDLEPVGVAEVGAGEAGDVGVGDGGGHDAPSVRVGWCGRARAAGRRCAS